VIPNKGVFFSLSVLFFSDTVVLGSVVCEIDPDGKHRIRDKKK
jgi:hypothetical protein